MFNLSLRYIFSLFLLFLFGACFFSSEIFMPYLRNWKSNKLYNLSKIYQDESITNESNLLEDGVRKARIATLLNSQDEAKKENFLKLLFRLEPTEALLIWSDSIPGTQDRNDQMIELVRKSLKTLRNTRLRNAERVIAGEIALKHLNVLEKNSNWYNNPDHALLSAEILAEVGSAEKSKLIIQ